MLPDISPFLHLRGFVSIAHHVPGRIRLKLDMGALARVPKVDPSPFLDFFARIRGIKVTRINKAALSVVVEYDPVVIAPAVWPRLISGDAAEVTEILTAHAA